MHLISQYLHEEEASLQFLEELKGNRWYAHYIKKDESKKSFRGKEAETPRLTVKYNPERELWKVFIKPSGIRKHGITKEDGSIKHVVSNGLELSFIDNKIHLTKVVMVRAREIDMESDVFQQMKDSTDVITYQSSSINSTHSSTIRK